MRAKEQNKEIMAANTAVAALATDRKVVNLSLTEKSYNELQELSKSTGRTMSDLVRFGLSLVKLYLDEKEKGNQLVVANSKGRAVMKILFPS